MQLHVGSGTVEERTELCLDKFGLALLDDEHMFFAGAEFQELAGNQRVGDVEHVKRHVRFAIDVGEAKPLQGTDDAVVHATLDDNAEFGGVRPESLVQAALADEGLGGRPTVLDLVLLMRERHGRQDDAREVGPRLRQSLAHREARALIIATLERSRDVAGADTHHQHDGRIRGFGKLETIRNRLHDRGQIGARVEQPELRLHGEGVGALLHDGGAFAVVFADDDHRATRHARRGEIGQRIGRDVDTDRALEGDGAANGVVYGSRQHRAGGRFIGVGFETHAEFGENFLRIRQHIHQVAYRRTLIAADITDA